MHIDDGSNLLGIHFANNREARLMLLHSCSHESLMILVIAIDKNSIEQYELFIIITYKSTFLSNLFKIFEKKFNFKFLFKDFFAFKSFLFFLNIQNDDEVDGPKAT